MMSNLEALKHKIVTYQEISDFHPGAPYQGIRAITFDGVPIENRKTKVFAYLGYPAQLTEKVPAIVLVHGGGGVPFLEWVKLWTDRGYAAIALSLTGDFPKFAHTGDYPEHTGKHREAWEFGLYGSFLEDGYTNAPQNDAMKNSEKAYEHQWMYHAVSQTILAGNILRNDCHIDDERIGITGISWGGVITSITIGYDERFKFAIPIYGSGYQRESMGFVGEYFRAGNNPNLWLAEERFHNFSSPILWLCWNADTAFSLNANSMSYRDTVKNHADTRLSAVHEMRHAHFCGWAREESYVFADSVCKGGKRLPAIDPTGAITNPDAVSIAGVKLYYIKKPMTYVPDEKNVHMEEEWSICDCPEGELTVPGDAAEYYLELTCQIDGKEYVTSSELIQTSNKSSIISL